MKLQKIIFYLLIFLIPSNLAKHWPQNWSSVNGILVDYLIPTLYLTDILIIILLGLWLVKKKRLKTHASYFLFYILLGFLFVFKAKNQAAATYKLVKITEFLFLFFYIKSNINIKKSFRNIVLVLSVSVIWQSTLAIFQWIKQGSIFGYWFFGEQPYNSATLGIKFIDFFGQLKIPPYGTFPHPNVLAGFLTVSLLFIFSYLINNRLSKMLILSFLLGITALFLTFSLPAWIALAISSCLLRFRKKGRIPVFYALGSMFFIFWGLAASGFIEFSSIYRRLTLNKIAFEMWLSSPFLGVGLNNFIVRMEDFGQVIANYRFLQPVHNIYLLILSETGIVGFLAVGWTLLTVAKRLSKQKNYLLITTYSLLLFLGLFDHYFLTLQQGMLLTALTLGLALH